MSTEGNRREKLPKGVTRLARSRGGRLYLASIRKGKGATVHLGLYESAWLAGLAYVTAAEALGREAPPLPPTGGSGPSSDVVRRVVEKVRRRLGLESDARRWNGPPPTAEDWITFFEITVIGFWRGQAEEDHGGPPGAGLDSAAARLESSARLLFWGASPDHPSPLDAMTEALARRLNREFGRGDVTRGVLDDDGDEPLVVSRWLVHPDAYPGNRVRGFRAEVIHRYADLFEADDESDMGAIPRWAGLLGLAPPYNLERARAAYRARSMTAHPDAGGSHDEFVRLRAAFDEAVAYCESRGAS